MDRRPAEGASEATPGGAREKQPRSVLAAVSLAVVSVLVALLIAIACVPRPPPTPGPKAPIPPTSHKDPDLQMFDPALPCLTVGAARGARRALFGSYPRPNRQEWMLALNRALGQAGSDCADPVWIALTVSIVQMESGVQIDPPLAEPDLEALFVRRMEAISDSSILAAGALTLTDFDEALRKKLRADSGRGQIGTEGALARYAETDLRPWLRRELSVRYLLPDSVVEAAETRWLPDPVQTIGPMQVNAAKAFRNAVARGEALQSVRDMRRLLLDPETALSRGLREGVAQLWPSYKHYRERLPPRAAARFAAADYNAGEFSSRNAAYQEMLVAISGRDLALDGDLLIYAGDSPSADSSASELAVLAALPGLTELQIRADLTLEKSATFDESRVAREICAAYTSQLKSPCPQARIPTGAANPGAGIKLGRTYSPANYTRAVDRLVGRNLAAFNR